MNPTKKFQQSVRERIQCNGENFPLNEAADHFMQISMQSKYSYNFSWLGRPIIQYPQDLIAMQEIIWRIKPDLIIETGIAHGGSLIFYASLLELIGQGMVIGIDIDIRSHNRKTIEKHPLFKRIHMIEGSSISTDTLSKVNTLVNLNTKVLVCLDSNHTYEHVLEELNNYSPFVTPGSYLIVFDTIIEDMPMDYFPDRPWGGNNNPKRAVREFLQNHQEFVIDKNIEKQLLITAAPSGYLFKKEK